MDNDKNNADSLLAAIICIPFYTVKGEAFCRFTRRQNHLFLSVLLLKPCSTYLPS